MNIYRVTYGWVYDGDYKDCDTMSSKESVAAESAEHAIARIRREWVGQRYQASDDDGNKIKGKFTVVTDIRVRTVEMIGDVDYVATSKDKPSLPKKGK